MSVRELSDVERAAMEIARDELYPAPHNASHADTVDVARWDAFEAGYKAALAARDEAMDLASDRLAAITVTLNEHAAPTHDENGFALNAAGRLRRLLAAREAGKLPGDAQPQTEPRSDGVGKDGAREASVAEQRREHVRDGDHHQNVEAGSSPRLHPEAGAAQKSGPACEVCGDERILMEPDGSKAQPCYACQPAGTTLQQACRPYTEREHEPPQTLVPLAWVREWARGAADAKTERERGSVVAYLEARLARTPDLMAALKESFAEHHADVLAKALDEFLRHPRLRGTRSERNRCISELADATEPTLRALGYPKEETG